MSTRPRAGRRSTRRFLVLPLVVVALAAGIKLVTMYVFAATGANAYTDSRYESSETNFGRLETLNVADPWRAHVGVGDAQFRQGDLLAAAAAFTRALELAPDRCEIRFNLAVTLEAQGDRLVVGEELIAPAESDRTTGRASTDGPSDPAERYSAALGVVEAGECPSQRVDDPGDRLAATQARLIAKLAALDADRADDEALEPENATESERGDSEQIDELELRNDSGASQREEARDRDTSGAMPDGQSNW
jgi:Tetratricopeptide repeat